MLYGQEIKVPYVMRIELLLLGARYIVEIDRTVKVGVISSLVATCVFIYLLQPIVRFVTYLLFDLTGTLFQTYKDRLFEQAALLHGPDAGLFVLVVLFAAIVGMASTSLALALFLPKLLSAARGQDSPVRRELSPRAHRVRITFAVVLLFALMVLPLLVIYSMMFQLRIVTSFNQHITAIAPYVEEKELLILKSQWTQMKSEEDYKQIYIDLQNVAARNDILLPENKVFSLTAF